MPALVAQQKIYSDCNELNVPTIGSIDFDGHKMLFTSVMDYITTLFTKEPQDGCGCCGCSPCCC